MIEEERDEDLPLHAEAQARAKWRGGDTSIDKGDKTVGLPARGGGDTDGGDGRPGSGRPGHFPPPD